MVTSLKEQPLKRQPVYRNIHITQLTSYRLPPAGWVSILHRISGAAMFLLLPFAIWMFDTSVTDEVSFDQFRNAFVGGIGFVPAFIVKLAALALIWGFLQHFCAGVRHLYMDFTHTVDKEFGRVSALVAMGVAAALTLVFAYKLFIGY